MKFKVNDKVTIVKRNSGNRTGASSEFHKPNGDVGKKGYVEKIFSGSGRFLVMDINATDDGSDYLGIFDADELELTSKIKEVNKKYKLIQCYPGSPEVGTIYTPEGYSGCYNYNGGDYTTALPRELLLDKTFFEEVKEQYKVGDYVYILVDKHLSSELREGQVGKILTNSWGNSVVIETATTPNGIAGNTNTGYGFFRLATQEEILVHLITKSGLKVGDKVKPVNGVHPYCLKRKVTYNLSNSRTIQKFILVNNELAINLCGDGDNHPFRVSDWVKVEEPKVNMIGEYELVNNNNGTIFLGCQTYTLGDVKAVRRTMEIGQLKEVTLRGTAITGKILSLLEAAINRTEPIVKFGLQFKVKEFSTIYTISRVGDKTVTVSWDNDTKSTDYGISNVETYISSGTWIVIG